MCWFEYVLMPGWDGDVGQDMAVSGYLLGMVRREVGSQSPGGEHVKPKGREPYLRLL
jgi:hypothetical protein